MTHELKITRQLAAPRQSVWRCWTVPSLIEQWYCPAPWRASEADFDLKPGGRMNIVMNGPEGERILTEGCFLKVVPETELIFCDALTEGFVPSGESFMTGYVLLSDAADGGTRMVWGALHADEAAVRQHLEMGFEEGWSAAASQLEDIARKLSSPPHLPPE